MPEIFGIFRNVEWGNRKVFVNHLNIAQVTYFSVCYINTFE